MTNFAGKILYLKTLMIEDGIGEILERLKLMLVHNKQRLNDLFHFEGRFLKLNKDLGFEFITRDKYNSELANLRKALIDFLDGLHHLKKRELMRILLKFIHQHMSYIYHF